MFLLSINFLILAIVVWMIGWIFFGIFVGGGMFLFVFNLFCEKVLIVGGLGGVLGVICFFLFNVLVGVFLVCLVGVGILGFCIGLVIVFSE